MQESMIEQNIVITEPSRNLRALGRNALAGQWQNAIITVIIYIVCMEIPPLVFNSLFGVNVGNVLMSDGYTYGLDPSVYAGMYNNMPNYSFLSSVYTILVVGPLTLGLTMFFLALFRRHTVKPVDTFLGFERFGKAVGLLLFQSLFIFLWTLLFIVPGIIASIRYSQAFFILADDPTKGIRQCVNESKAMMKGNKAKYFCLSLSFIGWIILSSIPSSILQSIGGILSTNDFVISLFAIIGYLFVAPVTAYMLSTQAGFYEILAGHLIKETKPAPIDPALIEEVVPVATVSEEEISSDDDAEEADDTEESDEAEKPDEAEVDADPEVESTDVAEAEQEAETEQTAAPLIDVAAVLGTGEIEAGAEDESEAEVDDKE